MFALLCLGLDRGGQESWGLWQFGDCDVQGDPVDMGSGLQLADMNSLQYPGYQPNYQNAVPLVHPSVRYLLSHQHPIWLSIGIYLEL